MKWETAVGKIEKALAEGKEVRVWYHRKWMKNSQMFGTVDSVVGYDYKGQSYMAVNTFGDQIDGYSHIIDEVTA